MKFVTWIKNCFPKAYVQTLEELTEELRVTEEQIHIGMVIAKANPGHQVLWDSVFNRVDEAKKLREQIKMLEEEEDEEV